MTVYWAISGEILCMRMSHCLYLTVSLSGTSHLMLPHARAGSPPPRPRPHRRVSLARHGCACGHVQLVRHRVSAGYTNQLYCVCVCCCVCMCIRVYFEYVCVFEYMCYEINCDHVCIIQERRCICSHTICSLVIPPFPIVSLYFSVCHISPSTNAFSLTFSSPHV